MLRLLCLLSFFCLCGCQTLQKKPAEVPFHALYQPIENAKAQRFLQDGIRYLKQNYGSVEYPIREVLLRYSSKNDIGRRYRVAEHFSKTEVVDAQAGVFAIYIAVPVGDPEFFPLLAHEIAHLKEPKRVDDWEMEGFCMVFSEKLCAELGEDWSIWKKKFTRESKDPYAMAYWKALDR